MSLPTASSLWLAALCPASHVLPQTRIANADMARGTAVHRYLEALPQVGRARALADVPPEHLALCERIDPAQVPQGEREAAFAWNVDTGAVVWLGSGIGRDYNAALRRKLEERDEGEAVRHEGTGRQQSGDHAEADRRSGSRRAGEVHPAPQREEGRASAHGAGADVRGRWVFGTADVVEGIGRPSGRDLPYNGLPLPAEGATQPGQYITLRLSRPTVLDYKVTDVPIDARGLLKPAAQSHQLRFLALAVARWSGEDVIEVAHLRVLGDGRIDGSDRASLGYFDLAQIESEVRSIVAGVERAAAQAQPDLNPGDHCRFCPAAHRCPATLTLIEAVVEVASNEGFLVAPESTEAQAWLFLRRARVALDLLDEELRRRAALVPIRLPDGREVREVETVRQELDARVAHGVMRDAYGGDASWQVLETSKAAIQRVTGGGAGLRSVLKEIEARGGVKLTTVKRVMEVAPPRDVPALTTTPWPEDMDPEDFTALHVGTPCQD